MPHGLVEEAEEEVAWTDDAVDAKSVRKDEINSRVMMFGY